MEIFYKVSMSTFDGSGWLVMDSGDKKEMERTLTYYRKMMPQKKFRLEKHTMEVVG